ncbi:MAG TPA: gamma-glutamylcyclotransferase family protein [Acidobacteriota bacterium]
MDYLFTYGTLRQGHATGPIAGVVRKLKKIGKGWVRGKLYDLGEFPGAVLNEAARSRIAGEVYEITDPNIWETLNSYEGYDPADPSGSLFVLQKCPAELEDGQSLECRIYVFNQDPQKWGQSPI